MSPLGPNSIVAELGLITHLALLMDDTCLRAKLTKLVGT